jgi:hypothetical protein
MDKWTIKVLGHSKIQAIGIPKTSKSDYATNEFQQYPTNPKEQVMGIFQTQEIKKNQTRNLSKITKQINSTSNGSLQNINKTLNKWTNGQ